MPTSVLNQLKALRDGVAQDLRKDPRYLTLQALDKSIEEISSVLVETGLLPPPQAPTALSQRMSALAPKADPYAEPVAVLSAASSAHHDAHPDHKPGFKDGTAGTPQPAVPHHALTSYAGEVVAVAGAAALTASVVHASDAPTAPAGEEDGDHEAAAAPAARLATEPAADHVPEAETPDIPADAAGTPEVTAAATNEEHLGSAFEAEAAEAVAAALAFGATDLEAHETHEPEMDAVHPGEPLPVADEGHVEAFAAGSLHANESHAAAAEGPAHEAHADLAAHAGTVPADETGAPSSSTAPDTAFETAAADAIAAALFAGDGEADHEFSGPSAHEAAGDHETAPEAGHEDAPAAEHETAGHEDAIHEPALAAAAASAIASALFLDETPESEGEPAGSGHEPAGPDPLAARAEPATATIIPEGKASGYIAMAAKPGAASYSPSIAVKFGKLPNKVDLRPLLAPIENQGQYDSSVANAVTSAYEYWIKKATKKSQQLSRLFVYYNARWRLGLEDNDAGAVIQFAMDGLQKFGACQNSAWPGDPHLLTKRPGADAYQNGAPYRIHDMAQMPLKLDSWKQALAEGKPVVFAVAIFESFQHCAETGGAVTMPAPEDLGHLPHAAHALCAVGYNEAEQVFIVRNSWGPAFGDGGYCYMPYSYVLNPKLNDGDCWIFIPKVPSQPPRETWHDAAGTVINGGKGAEVEHTSRPVADYATVAADLFEGSRQPFEAHAPDGYNDCAAKVAKNMFAELPDFDVKSFLETTTILAGIGSAIHSMVDGAPPAAGPAAGAPPESDEDWGSPDSWGTSTAIDHDRGTGAGAKISA